MAAGVKRPHRELVNSRRRPLKRERFTRELARRRLLPPGEGRGNRQLERIWSLAVGEVLPREGEGFRRIFCEPQTLE